MTSALALPLEPMKSLHRNTQTIEHQSKRANSPLTAETLIQIAPRSASCSGTSFPEECRTAEQAVPWIIKSFERYDIIHPATQAAIVALMAYESNEFSEDTKHQVPGDASSAAIPGVCTRNMQSSSYNDEYATSLGMPGSSDPTAMCAALGADEYSFGSAAWFIHTQCSASTREALWEGSYGAYENYLLECVQVGQPVAEIEQDRKPYWDRAMAAFRPRTDSG